LIAISKEQQENRVSLLKRMADSLERRGSIEEALENRETWMIAAESAGAFAIFFLALIGNVILSLALYRCRALRRKIQNYYIIALTMSDLLLTVLCLPMGLAVVMLGRWPFGDTLCQIQGILTYFFACFSLLTLTLIAINRYVKMIQSVIVYQKAYTRNYVLSSIMACAVFSGAFVIPFVSQKFCYHPGKLACFVCKSLNKKEQALLLGPYSVLIAMTYPVLAFCYFKVFRKVHSHFAQIAASSLQEDNAKSFAEEVQITKILFAVLIAFVICWSPAFTIEFLDTLKGEYSLPRQVYLIMPFAGAASSAINPVIYGVMQKRFRDAYKRILSCKN